AFGAGLYESRIALPEWTGAASGEFRWDAETARRHDTGRRFWVFVTTVPLTLLTLASLVLPWRTEGPVRRWWLAAGVAALADRVFTFAYFIPTMVKLMSQADSPEARSTVQRWARLNYLRHAFSLAALLLALQAFAAWNRREGEPPEAS